MESVKRVMVAARDRHNRLGVAAHEEIKTLYSRGYQMTVSLAKGLKEGLDSVPEKEYDGPMPTKEVWP